MSAWSNRMIHSASAKDCALNRTCSPYSRFFGRVSLVGVALGLMLAGRVDAGDWQTFPDCCLVEHPANDGDSFHIQAGDKPILVRLYFVDCPETAAATDGDAKRVREQALHFGVVKMSRVLHYGEEARIFVAQVLSKPFTVRTAFATAFGRSSTPRVYGMITTAEGKDLGSLLVEKGLARAFGTKRKTPDGLEGNQMMKQLQDLELQAMRQRAGIWSETDLGKLDEMRAQQRGEEEEMKELRRQLQGEVSGPADINKATVREIQSVAGLGPVLASRLIEGRPYKSVDELLRVPGINQKLLERLRPQLTVSGSPP